MKIVSVDEPIVARALSFVFWQRIYIGTKFNRLTQAEQAAAITHERAHCILAHTEHRLFFLILAPFLFCWLCRQQEFEADRLAVEMGHAKGLLSILEGDYPGSRLTPSHAARREAIKQQEQIRLVRVTDYSPDAA